MCMALPLSLTLLRKPAGLALLAKGRPAFGRFGRLEALVEFALKLGQQLLRYWNLRQAAKQLLGMRQRVRAGVQHFVDDGGQCGVRALGCAELMRGIGPRADL